MESVRGERQPTEKRAQTFSPFGDAHVKRRRKQDAGEAGYISAELLGTYGALLGKWSRKTSLDGCRGKRPGRDPSRSELMI